MFKLFKNRSSLRDMIGELKSDVVLLDRKLEECQNKYENSISALKHPNGYFEKRGYIHSYMGGYAYSHIVYTYFNNNKSYEVKLKLFEKYKIRKTDDTIYIETMNAEKEISAYVIKVGTDDIIKIDITIIELEKEEWIELLVGK